MFYTYSYHFGIIIFVFYLEAVVPCCSLRSLLKDSQNSQENTCKEASFLSATSNFFEKETPAYVFSCELCKIFKNTLFY